MYRHTAFVRCVAHSSFRCYESSGAEDTGFYKIRLYIVSTKKKNKYIHQFLAE